MNIDNRLTIYGFDEQDETILNNRISKFGLTSVPAKAIAVYEIGSPNAADVTATLYNNGLLEFEGSGDIVEFWYYDEMPWYDYRSNITSVSFKTGNTIKPTSTAYLFYGLSNITSLDLSNLDTSNVTNMTWMFNGCESLIKIKGSENLVSSKVTTMERIFNYCISLSSLETSNWNTSNVSIMTGIFNSCKSLTSLDLSSFDTSNVTNMSYMFTDCKSLTSLDLSSFDTSNVTNMSYMFTGCESLTEIIGLDNFDTSKVTAMNNMFHECNNLSSSITIMCADITYFRNMFTNCSIEPGTEFIVKYKDTTEDIVIDMVATKSENSNVFLRSGIVSKAYNIGNPVASDVTATLYDDGCLEFNGSGDISTYASFYDLPWYKDGNYEHIISVLFTYRNNIKPTKIGSLFASLKNTVSINVSNLDTSLVTDMGMLFQRSSSLREIKGLENLNTSNVTNMAYMFESNVSKITLDLSNWDTSKVTSMNSMFSGANNISGSLTIMNPNITYSNMFIYTSTASDSQFIVKYIDEITKNAAQNMVNTKSSNSNVILWVPPVTLLDGDSFSAALQSLNAGMETPTITFSKEYTNVTWTDTVLVSTSDSLTKAYAYYDIDTGFNIYPEISNAIICANSNSAYMFANWQLTDFYFDNFDTSNVEDMRNMFVNNSRIVLLNLSKWNTSNVYNMSNMFYGCSRLGSIYVKDLWDISNVINDENMFYGCTSIIGKSGTSYNSSKVGKEMANIETGYLTDEKLLLVKTAFESTYKITVINYEEYINIKTQPGVTSYNAQIRVVLYDTLEIGKSYKISIETFNGASFYSYMSGNSAGAGDGTWNTNGNISELIFTATSATSELVLFSTGFYMMLPNTPAVNVVNIRFYEIF